MKVRIVGVGRFAHMPTLDMEDWTMATEWLWDVLGMVGIDHRFGYTLYVRVGEPDEHGFRIEEVS